MGRPQHIVCWPKLDYLVILNNSLTLSPALSKIPIYSRSLFQEYFYILFFLYPEGDFFFFFFRVLSSSLLGLRDFRQSLFLFARGLFQSFGWKIAEGARR